MTKYAATTTVSREKSIAEIDNILRRYGADAFSYAWQGSAAMIMFQIAGRRIRFMLPMPEKSEFRFYRRTNAFQDTERTDNQVEQLYTQACRQRWRALALVIKAKLEAVESRIATIEDEFLAYIMLPNGQNISQWMSPQLEQIYASGKTPPMLAGPSS